MSDGMSPDQIAQVFTTLGRIEQKIDSHASILTAHTAQDTEVQKLLFERVDALRLSNAKRKGVMSALAVGWGIVTYAFGSVIEKWILGGHN